MVLQSSDYRLPFDQGFPNYSWDHKGMISKAILVAEVQLTSQPTQETKWGQTQSGWKKIQQNCAVKVIPPYGFTA